jgi:hypothetical protein
MYSPARRPRYARSNRTYLGFVVPLVAVSLTFFLGAPTCHADESTDITKVEEYWELDLHFPDAARGSPQLNFLISPTGSANGIYAVFIVNQRDGAIGGLQLQLWNGDSLLASSSFSDTSALGTAEEKLSWKTRVSIDQGTLTVEIVGLSSTTWGNFGNNSAVPGLSVSASTSLPNLNAYSLNVSADNFGIDFGNNRVKKVVLKKVVSFTGNQKSTDQLGSEKVIYDNP